MVENDIINDPATLGVAAAHLQLLAVFNEADSLFDKYYDGDYREEALEEILQYVPPSMESPWKDIMERTSLEKPKNKLPKELEPMEA